VSLSQKQLDAARRTGQDVCVLAGPGSGKTSVLIDRFAWLVTERAVSPHRILAITFTEKAATEIKQRMTARFKDNAAMREQIERAYVSTVHAFCARLLRENAIAAAVDPQFEVLDFAPSRSLLRDVADQVLEAIYQATPDRMRRFLRSLAVAIDDNNFQPDLAKSLIEIYDAMRVAGVDISAALLKAPDYSADWKRLRDIASAILSERPRTNTDNQVNEHAAIQDWSTAFLSLSGPPALDHFKLLSPKLNLGRLVKRSMARTLGEELRMLAAILHSRLLIDYYSAERELILESLQQIDRLYRERKRAISSLDFDDLEEFAITLLESNAPLRARVRNQFDYILMDELQDTNPLQWRLLGLLRREDNFFAVGDVNQSIFGFRHAQPELFHGYRLALESQGKEIDELRDNYRTLPPVLASVNAVFDAAAGIEAHKLIATRDSQPFSSKSVEVVCVQGETAEPTERIEALWVAQRITELVSAEQAHYRDIAILTRANIATASLQEALDQYGVPSIVLGGLTLFETREIRDLVLLLAVLVNPRNEVALAGVLRSPLFGVSDEELFRLALSDSISDAIERNPPAGWELIQSLREVRNSTSVDLLLRRVIDATDYESGLSSRARANIEKFLGALRTRYEGKPVPLSKILADVESATPDSEAPPADFGDAVRLMTIHKSKGLEFPVVFLPFLHSSRGTGFPTVSYSHVHGLGVNWRDPVTRQGKPDTLQRANREHLEARQAAEDNRVLYVGMTRAKDRLVLSYSETKYSRGKWSELIKSRLPVDLVVDAPPVLTRAASAAASVQSTTILSRPSQAGQQDATASATDISLFRQCPRKYYLSRYLGFSGKVETSTQSTPAVEIGTEVHALLAGQILDDAHPESVRMAQAFRDSELGRQSSRSVSKAHEYDFVFALDGVVLRGQIDLWFERNRDLVIVDYKTDRNVNPGPYELQLQIYALALERALRRAPTHGYLHFLRANEIVEVDLSPLALNGAHNAVHEFSAAQETLDFPLTPGQHCHRCEHFQKLCPAVIPTPVEQLAQFG
jgi:ATP-dependent helicase/nuclease subunit A